MGESNPLDIKAYLHPGNTGDFLTNEPLNINHIQSPGHLFHIQRLPNLSYFCQRLSMPGINIGSFDMYQKGLAKIPFPGNVEFNDLSIDFFIDENMKNWLELSDWMRSTTTFEDFNQIDDIPLLWSNATLFLLNSAMNPKFKVEFRDIIPVSISDIQFDTTVTEISPITATATFKYTTYTLTQL